MKEIAERVAGPVLSQTPLEHTPKKHVMGTVHSLARLVMHAQTYFETGAIDELHEHRDSGGSTLILMTHFRRWDPIVMAQIARTEEPLRHLQYTTGITARRSLFYLPVAGYIVRNSGAQIVDRLTESVGETPEQKVARKEANQKTQTAGAQYLAHGYNWLIYPEGGSKKVTTIDGQQVKEPREPGVLLPLHNGFIYTLEAIPEQDRDRVRMLGIVVHYGERRLSSLRPTVHVSRPLTPANDPKQIKQQGKDLLQRGLDEAMRLDARRS